MKILLRRGHAGRRWELGKAGLGAIPDMIYLLTPKDPAPSRIPVVLAGATERRAGAAEASWWYFCEQPPDPASRVQLGGGGPAGRQSPGARLAHRRCGVAKYLASAAAARRAPGADRPRAPRARPSRFTDASHHMGTTRMSDDPRRGVVDRERPGPRGGQSLHRGQLGLSVRRPRQPTLTVVALALRLTEHLESASTWRAA